MKNNGIIFQLFTGLWRVDDGANYDFWTSAAKSSLMSIFDVPDMETVFTPFVLMIKFCMKNFPTNIVKNCCKMALNGQIVKKYSPVNF